MYLNGVARAMGNIKPIELINETADRVGLRIWHTGDDYDYGVTPLELRL